MKCTISGCPGEYEKRRVTHTVRHHGELLVIDNVPAEVCAVCGDVLLTPETVRAIERLLARRAAPEDQVPLYRYSA